MFPRSAEPRGRAARSQGPYLPPPASHYYDHQRRRADDFSRVYAPRHESLPPYAWRPAPPISPAPPRPLPPPPPPPTPAMTNGRKRQRDERSAHVAKRQRLDSSSHPLINSHLVQAPPPRHPPGHSVAGPSRSFVDVESSYPAPLPLQPQMPVTPEGPRNLLVYAKDKLSGQMVDLYEACQQQYSDLLQKDMCRTRLQHDVQSVFAEARLYMTGSSVNGLGCRSSDADLCLVLKERRRPDPISVLSVLQRLLRSLSYVDSTHLIRAKVPILRFRRKDSDLEFDLNINNTVGIRNTFLMKSYAYADLRIRPIILVVKKWARHNEINNASKGTLSSYTLVLMVLHYLQTLDDPVLPSLQRDYPECFSPFMDIDMVPEGPKHIPPYISRNHSSLGELLLGFLRYYATDFRWDRQVISVREGRTLPKNNSPEWRNKYICVEEPFERNNVARAVCDERKFHAIKAEFAKSWRLLRRKRDLNSILPVGATISSETSRS